MRTFATILSTVAAAAVISTAQPAASARAAAVPECRNADVTAAYRGGDHATLHTLGRIVLTNVSRRTCSVRGFGGLSYVGHGDGTQVGSAATRDPGTRVSTVVLAPGGRARSAVSETSPGAYGADRCTPVPVDGFRVYVPDARAAQFVAHPTTTCAQTDLDLLGHQAYRAR